MPYGYPYQGYGYPYPTYPYGAPHSNYPYGVPGYGVPMPRPHRDAYQLTLGIISVILLGLVVLGGLLVGFVIVFAIAQGSRNPALPQNLVIWTPFTLIGGVALAGGGVGLDSPSAPDGPSAVARMPTFWVPLG